MLNNLQKNILESAHIAAQKVCENNAWEVGVNSRALKRTHVLNKLEENGFGRFLLDKDNSIKLQPYSVITTKTKEDGHWYSYEKFNVSEVKAYLSFLGYDDDPLEFIQEEYGYDGYNSGPGGKFNTGMCYHLSKSGNRIIGSISGGLDV